MSHRDWQILKSLYDGETACLDQRIGILFDYLKEGGHLDNTLFIITSDHGDLLERKGMIGHHLALFDDLIHTPLIVRWPGVVPAGERFEGFVQICDWLPTFLDIIGKTDIARGEFDPNLERPFRPGLYHRRIHEANPNHRTSLAPRPEL